MPAISNVISELADLLATGQFDPAIREVTTGSALPPATFPQAEITVEDEVFSPSSADVTALANIRLACAKGRLADAREAVRSLAHQVRTALYGSKGLSGAVQALAVMRIGYGSDSAAEPGSPVVATAVVELELMYCEQEL